MSQVDGGLEPTNNNSAGQAAIRTPPELADPFSGREVSEFFVNSSMESLKDL